MHASAFLSLSLSFSLSLSLSLSLTPCVSLCGEGFFCISLCRSLSFSLCCNHHIYAPPSILYPFSPALPSRLLCCNDSPSHLLSLPLSFFAALLVYLWLSLPLSASIALHAGSHIKMTMGGQHMGRCEGKQKRQAHREGRERVREQCYWIIAWCRGTAHGILWRVCVKWMRDWGRGEWQGLVCARSRVEGLHCMVWHITFCRALTIALCPRCYKLPIMGKAPTRDACWLALVGPRSEVFHLHVPSTLALSHALA